MRIHELQLQNFKRFTDLTIKDIPDTAQLVLLIGSNGCGKSCVFDALTPQFNSTSTGLLHDSNNKYFAKDPNSLPNVRIDTNNSVFTREGDNAEGTEKAKNIFYGRSSLRIPPRVQKPEYNASLDSIVTQNIDKPRYFIEHDNRFFTDVHSHAESISQSLQRLLVEGNSDKHGANKVREKYISRINNSLTNIFGDSPDKTLRFTVYKQPDPKKPIEPYFRKGDSEIPFEVLSHGEKQVIITLFNFLVRQEQLQDKIIYIDEMDVHMNTRLQFTLLREITENWIPASSQLWTASHALGFIDYARQSEAAAIIDFDDLDYDQPQVLFPEPKENLDILEIAVPSQFLQELLSEKRFVFCEGKDTARYNSLGLSHTLFASKNYNKFQVFIRARDTAAEGIIDRDYLSDEEVIDFERQFPFIHILRLYSIENYLYHPDNLAEVDGDSFDKAAYITALTTEKNRIKEDLIFGIQKAREGYPFNKELNESGRKAYAKSAGEILKMLQSDDFATFYKVFPAKDYGKQLPQRANRSPAQLAQTQWFKQQIAELL
ncbi:hypothetical protein AB833_00275 [Chromatiales bacterium (ex Bugula neritina AB1)]|nr:hypothetical protein AB833_00275 [Chromatiales bacterium (ex Bugula neritina AB1)]